MRQEAEAEWPFILSWPIKSHRRWATSWTFPFWEATRAPNKMAAARARCARSCFSCIPAGPLSTEFVFLAQQLPYAQLHRAVSVPPCDIRYGSSFLYNITAILTSYKIAPIMPFKCGQTWPHFSSQNALSKKSENHVCDAGFFCNRIWPLM